MSSPLSFTLTLFTFPRKTMLLTTRECMTLKQLERALQHKRLCLASGKEVKSFASRRNILGPWNTMCRRWKLCQTVTVSSKGVITFGAEVRRRDVLPARSRVLVVANFPKTLT